VEVIKVDDAATLASMRLAWTELKQTIEPSSAVVLAALLAQRGRFAGPRVGLVLSGGNVVVSGKLAFNADQGGMRPAATPVAAYFPE
ncbi:MAG TPA: hypothetical protein VFW73_00690, partial [Lacipirellulaceae bacterium]|nr:hypothetical protein [Lacipirellulaceae bacterium]